MSHANLVLDWETAHYCAMAFRIEDSVVRGEIDNRAKGIVRGRVWIEGRAEPIILELEGNAWPDLAGCLLTFANPQKRIQHQHLDSLHSLQRGTIGDLTASRKVRVLDVPLEQAMEMCRRKEKPPEHMANSIYLEWFSEANGRVVIESADYEVTISAPEWRITPEEEQLRAQQAAAGMQGFMQRLTDAVQAHRRSLKDPEDNWDEQDYEKFLKESDARTDRYMELLDKYGHSEEAQEKIAREMGWDDEDTATSAERGAWVEEMNEALEHAQDATEPEPDPAREGIDWIRTERGDLAHPLQHRCFESVIRVRHQVKDLGIEASSDPDLGQFVGEFQITGAKLAGALGSIARGAAFPEPAFTVARLRRALDHLHKSQTGLEALAPKRLLPEALVAEARKELFEIREGILQLMDRYRGRPSIDR